jgi:CRP/FNR family transcriptional regulator
VDQEQIVAALQRNELFRGLHPSVIGVVAGIVEERFSPPGQHFFFQGDLATEFFVCCSGRVRVYVPGPGDELDMGIVTDGRMFGEGGLIDGGPRVASAVALDPSTALAIPRDAWLSLLVQVPDLAQRVLLALGASVRRYMSEAVDLLFLDVEIPEFPPEEDLPRA